jgi:hypothetical protein
VARSNLARVGGVVFLSQTLNGEEIGLEEVQDGL